MTTPKYICGVGASAGGLEALERFFAPMGDDNGIAFIVVQHLSPSHKSMMNELLSKHTSMPVEVATDGIEMAANHVYLIPPGKNLEVSNGRLLVSDQDRSRHEVNLPIDYLFCSMGREYRERAISVVLSGTGSDGTRGLRVVKENGGWVLVQQEESAKFDGMPRSAIATGLADFILPPEDMAEQLRTFLKHPYSSKSTGDHMLVQHEDDLTRIMGLLRKKCGTDFTFYKPRSVARRIERRMNVQNIQNLPDYARYLEQAPEEVEMLFKELLISVTNFFRDPTVFDTFVARVLPEIVRRAEGSNVPLRFWVPACATGEEAYSLAMLVREYLDEHKITQEVKIFATDIDKKALEIASAGMYPESIAADVTADRLTRYFSKEGPHYKISRAIREMVIFATHDVTKDPPFTKLDLVSLRNLLIYFQPTLQQKVLALVHFALKPEAFLTLGTSESIGELTTSFEPLDHKAKIYRSRSGVRHSLASQIGMPGVASLATRSVGKTLASARAKRIKPASERAAHHLINQHAPPSVVTTEDGQLIHSFGDLSETLSVRPGKASLNIFDMVRDELSIALTTASHRVRKSRSAVTYNGIRSTNRNGEDQLIDVTVAPLEREKGEEFALVFSFEATHVTRTVGDVTGQTFDANETLQQQLNDTQQELQYMRESLQATIEELETSNEELQSTNEELLSSNEELQSTNEELHSVNEELYTVNAEYQHKIVELQNLHSQFDALLTHSAIGWLFLDNSLHIRKFTPSISQDINVIDGDIGRPLIHIAHNLAYEDLHKDAALVASGRRDAIEKCVSSEAGDEREVMVRMIPHGVVGNETGGVVISLVDITSLRARIVVNGVQESEVATSNGSVSVQEAGHP